MYKIYSLGSVRHNLGMYQRARKNYSASSYDMQLVTEQIAQHIFNIPKVK